MIDGASVLCIATAPFPFLPLVDRRLASSTGAAYPLSLVVLQMGQKRASRRLPGNLLRSPRNCQSLPVPLGDPTDANWLPPPPQKITPCPHAWSQTCPSPAWYQMHPTARYQMHPTACYHIHPPAAW